VVLGEHAILGRKAAIKVLRPELTLREELVQRFFNEARAANQIEHPGIVDIYEIGEDESHGYYLVMELLEGQTLGQLIEQEGKIPLERVNLLLRRIASPLTAAHAAGIIHRDLKPDNIFILPDIDHPGDLRVKLLDFGIAKLLQAQANSHTATGAILGTPYYMSPEQAHGAREIDDRTDIYSLGVIVYQLLCGKLPFTATAFGELLLKHQMETPPPLTQYIEILPTVEAQVMRAMAKDPDARFQSVREFAGAFAHAAGAPLDGVTLPPRDPAKVARAETLVPKSTRPPDQLPNTLFVAKPPTDSAAKENQAFAAGTHPPLSITAEAHLKRTWVMVGVFSALLLLGGGGIVLYLALAGDGVVATDDGNVAPRVQDVHSTPRSKEASTRQPRDRAPEVFVPAGPFTMGNDKGAAEEKPQHQVVLAAFYIDRHEVTVEQFRRCVKGGGCDGRQLDGQTSRGFPFEKSPDCNWGHNDRANHPLNCVTWHQAADYCRWAGKRLVREAEWEKAARGTDGRLLPWKEGEANCQRAVIAKGKKAGCGNDRTEAVGSRSPAGDSPYEAQDMLGNVAEWVEDYYASDTYSTRLAKTSPENPRGPTTGKERTFRGGGFTDKSDEVRVTARLGADPSFRTMDVGFRCARSAAP